MLRQNYVTGGGLGIGQPRLRGRSSSSLTILEVDDLIFITNGTVSAESADLQFIGLAEEYIGFVVILADVEAEADGDLRFETSTDNGSSWESTSGDYNGVYSRISIGVAENTSITTAVECIDNVGGADGEGFTGIFHVMHPEDSGLRTHVFGEGFFYFGSGTENLWQNSAIRTDAVDNNAFRFRINGQSLDSGSFWLYGIEA